MATAKKRAAATRAAKKSSATTGAAGSASTSKKAATKKAPAKQTAAKQTTAKQTTAKKTTAKQTTAKQTTAKQTTAKQAPAKQTTAKKTTAKQAPAKQAAGTKKTAAKPTKRTAADRAAKRPGRTSTSAGGAAADSKQGGASRGRRSTPKATKATKSTMATTTSAAEPTVDLPKPRFNKEGLGYTKDFDLSFVKEQYEALQTERVRLTGQARRLEDEAHQLVEEAEMGDVQFDDEGGEGDTMVVERERDLALSAQAREAVVEIDAALGRIMAGTYGYSIVSGRPIPRERLEAIPWASVLVEEKVGGIGRR